MIKTITILLVALAFVGCSEKEEATPQADCYCGQVYGWGGSEWTTDGRQLKWGYKIINNCTNAPWFVTMSSPIDGDEYCRGFQW